MHLPVGIVVFLPGQQNCLTGCKYKHYTVDCLIVIVSDPCYWNWNTGGEKRINGVVAHLDHAVVLLVDFLWINCYLRGNMFWTWCYLQYHVKMYSVRIGRNSIQTIFAFKWICLPFWKNSQWEFSILFLMNSNHLAIFPIKSSRLQIIAR